MSAPVRVLVPLLLGLATALPAAEQWRDHAEVLRVEPAAAVSGCDADATGDLRARAPGLGLTEALRHLVEGGCGAEPRVTAWRVVYRYQGRDYTRILPYRPGDRLPVEVRLEPQP